MVARGSRGVGQVINRLGVHQEELCQAGQAFEPHRLQGFRLSFVAFCLAMASSRGLDWRLIENADWAGCDPQVLHDLGVVLLYCQQEGSLWRSGINSGSRRAVVSSNGAPASGVGWGLESALSVFEDVCFLHEVPGGLFGGTGGFLFGFAKGFGFKG